jgi:hypothetical protein
MSSISPITPQTIDDLLTLVNNIIHRGIDAKMNVDQATAAAMKAIKNHPLYKKLVASGELNEKDFNDTLNEKLKKENDEKQGNGSGNGKAQGASKKAQNNGGDVISERGRTESDKAA